MLHYYFILHRNGILLILSLISSVLLTSCATFTVGNQNQYFADHNPPYTITVYPVNIVKETGMQHDSALGGDVTDYIASNKMAKTILTLKVHSYSFVWNTDPAKMSQQSSKAFASQVKNDHIQTDYALLVEILCNNDETSVLGVSYYLVDKNGNVQEVTYSNPTGVDFKQVKPTNRYGGLEIAKRMMLRSWRGQ
jgi:hypothetical protein